MSLATAVCFVPRLIADRPNHRPNNLIDWYSFTRRPRPRANYGGDMSERALQVASVWRCVRAWRQMLRRIIATPPRQAITVFAITVCWLLFATAVTAAPRGEAALDQESRNEAINSIPFDQ